MKEGEMTFYSHVRIWCAKRKSLLLLIIVKCSFLYNKCPFAELKWKLLSCDPAINMLISVWGMLEFTYHSPRRRKTE